MAIDDFGLSRGGAPSANTRAVKIPTYQQRTAPSGQINTRAANVQVSDAVGQAMSNAGRAIGGVADYMIQKEKYKQELDANSVYSQSLLDLDEWYNKEAKASMKPGGEGFTDVVKSGIDEHIKKAVTDRKGSEYWSEEYQKRMLGVRTKMVERAMHDEMAEGLRHETSLIATEREKSQKIIDRGSATFEQENARIVEMIQKNPKLTLAAKDALTKSVTKEQAFTDQVRLIKENPHAWLGKNPPKPGQEMSGGTGSATYGSTSLANAIYGQESSGGKADTSKVNSQNVTGPMQMQQGTFDGMKKKGIIPADYDWKNPEHNKDAGFKWVDYLYKKYDGDSAKVAAAYYGGEGAVNADGTINRQWKNKQRPNDPTVGEYIDQVLARVGHAGRDGGSVKLAGSPTGGIGPINRGQSYDALDWELQQRLFKVAEHEISMANQQANRERQTWASNLQYEMQNLSAKTAEMVQDKSPWRTEDEFMSAYADSPEQGRRAYAEYAESKLTNERVAGMKGATGEQLDSIMKEPPPPETDPDFKTSAAGQNARQKAAAAVLTARQKDPWAFAATNGDFGVKPLDGQQPLGDQFARRYAALPSMQKQYGFNPGTLLTAQETATLTRQLSESTAEGKQKILSQIAGSIPDTNTYLSVLQSISKDSPVTANAGAIAVQLPGKTISVGGTPMTTQQVAQTILLGEQLLNPPKTEKDKDGIGKRFLMPKESEMRALWNSAVGETYAGFPDAEHVAYQTFEAYYAGKASRTQGMGKADSSPLGNVAKEAIDAATGGIVEWSPSWFGRSQKLPLPYGMPKDQFADAVAKEWAVVGKDFKRVKYDDIQLRPLGKGNGMYVVQLGTEDQVGTDGNPLIMDLSGYTK